MEVGVGCITTFGSAFGGIDELAVLLGEFVVRAERISEGMCECLHLVCVLVGARRYSTVCCKNNEKW